MSIGTDEWDFGSATPDDGMLGWNPSTPIDYSGWSGNWLPTFDNAINSVEAQVSGGTTGGTTSSDWNSITEPRSVGGGLIDFGSGSTQSGGVSPLLTEPPAEKGFLGKFFDWFSDDKSGLKGQAAIALGGSFLSGIAGAIFSADARKSAQKNSEKIANAAERNAQTNADATNRKFANASSIAQTNFGAAPPGGLIFSNKLAPRQKRAGYGA